MATTENNQDFPTDKGPEQLYHQLTSLLSGSSITELEIVTYPIVDLETTNQHHPFLLFSDHQLAIPQKILYILYGHACKQFRDFHRVFIDLRKNSHLDPIPSKNQQNNPEFIQNVHRELFKLTQILLIQNPDHLTALSCRRNLIEFFILCCDNDDDAIHMHREKLISEELDFSKLILSIPSHSKSAGVWFHRRWCFSQIFPTEANHLPTKHNVSANLPLDVLNDELDFNLRCCDIYPRNYYGWFHRQWLIDQLINSTYTISINQEFLVEQDRVLKFLSVHPRDCSCLNYIHFLILQLIKVTNTITFTTSNTKNGKNFNTTEIHSDQIICKFLQDCFLILSDRTEYELIWSFLKFISSINKNKQQQQQQHHHQEEEGKKGFDSKEMIDLNLKFIKLMSDRLKTWLKKFKEMSIDDLIDKDIIITSKRIVNDNDYVLVKKNTLANQNQENLIQSIHLAIRTFYFILITLTKINSSSSDLNLFHSTNFFFNHDDDGISKFILESTKYDIFINTMKSSSNSYSTNLFDSSNNLLHLFSDQLQNQNQNQNQDNFFFQFFHFLDDLLPSCYYN